MVPFIENDRVIANLNGHFAGNYLGEETLITVAARHGYNTAAIGKVGPIVIQGVSEAKLVRAGGPQTVIIDDATGKSGGIPVDPRIGKAIAEAGLPVANGAPPKKPFVAVFWSRDPVGTQHNQGDGLNKLSPGINGPTSKAAVRNADDNLRQILEFVESTPGLGDNTDIFLTSDNGFSTISRHVYYFDSAGFEGRTVGLSGGE